MEYYDMTVATGANVDAHRFSDADVLSLTEPNLNRRVVLYYAHSEWDATSSGKRSRNGKQNWNQHGASKVVCQT